MEVLLMVNLQQECFFNTRNPRGTLFRAGSPLGTNMPVYYLAHENPYQPAVGEKRYVRPPRRRRKRSRMLPRSLQDIQDRPKIPQDRAKTAQDHPKTAQDRPKTGPRPPQDQLKTTQGYSKITPRSPKTAPRPPKSHSLAVLGRS